MPEGKVITVLQHRQEIEELLQALARVRTEAESEVCLLALASYGADVLPILIRHLDAADPWMVQALGRVVAQLEDRARAAEALRRAALSPDSSDRQRIVAIVLLDRFLEQPLGDDLFAALGNPTDVAVRALLEDMPARERIVRMDYLSIIYGQPLQEITYALDRFHEVGSDQAIEALRFMAMDERDALARSAIEALGSIRRPASLQALRILEPNVPSFRRPLVERAWRKLRFSGVPDTPLPGPPSGIRLLVSPLDGAGNRLLLLLFPWREPQPSEAGADVHGDPTAGSGYRGLHVFVGDEEGVQGAYEVSFMEEEIPPVAPVGTVHPAPHPWEGIYLLETTFPYVQDILRRALEYNEARKVFCPLEYRFFCDQIWGWSVPTEEPATLPQLNRHSQQTVTALLGHPYLASWFLDSEAISEAARPLLQADLSHAEGQGLLAVVTVSLIQGEFSAFVCLRYARRLRDTAEWFLRAGQGELAAVARGAAEEMDSTEPLRSMFALMLMQKSLLVAVANLRRGLAGRE